MLDNNFAFAVVHSQFPHVGHRLKDHWNEPDFPEVIEELLNPNPKRQGFPRGVLNALRSLAPMHEMEVNYSERLGDQPQLTLNLEH
ncbi:hypothetical protein [Rhodoferax lacus]|nr:hypothetical protein [Rhodoferax lacus]